MKKVILIACVALILQGITIWLHHSIGSFAYAAEQNLSADYQCDISTSYQNYPNREAALQLAIKEIESVSKLYEASVPDEAFREEHFTSKFLGLDGIWMRWQFDFRFYDHNAELYYYGKVLVEMPPESIEADVACSPMFYIEPITEEIKNLLRLTELERSFSNKIVDAWNYKERAGFYEQYGTIRDIHASNRFVSDFIESKPIFPGEDDPTYYEALIKTFTYYYTDYLNDTLFNRGFICKEHGLLCRNPYNMVIGSGFYECTTSERFWVIRFFKVLNVGGQDELLELHAFRYENGEVYPTI